METNYKAFVKTLYEYVYCLNRYSPTNETQKILDVYKKLDMPRIIMWVNKVLVDNQECVNSTDEEMFKKGVQILPGLDISKTWSSLDQRQQKKSWTFLKMLLLLSTLVIEASEGGKVAEPRNNKQDSEKLETPSDPQPTGDAKEENTRGTDINSVVKSEDPNETTEYVMDFNPYEGIKGGDDSEFTVDDVYSGHSLDPVEFKGFDVESVMSMTGLDKIIDFSQITDQLKNISQEDIDTATANIKSLLGDNVDDETSKFLSDIFTDISNELKNTDMTSGGNTLQNMMNIAQKVSSNIAPGIGNNINLDSLLASAQNLSKNCRDESGKPVFDESQMGVLNNLMNVGSFGGPNQQTHPSGQPLTEEQQLQQLQQCMAQSQQLLAGLDTSGANTSGGNRGNRKGQPKKRVIKKR